MKKKVETGLIIVRDNTFTKIRKNIFAILFSKENELLNMLYDIQKPRNKINGEIIIPKEIKRY